MENSCFTLTLALVKLAFNPMSTAVRWNSVKFSSQFNQFDFKIPANLIAFSSAPAALYVSC